jgi:hypothetical protein
MAQKTKDINLKGIVSTILLVLFLSGCGIPVPEEKSDYVGAWESREMSLLILQDGSVEYKRLKKGGTVSVTGPIQEFQGDDFVVGIAFLKTTFEVSQPPYEENGEWKMVVDGVKLVKVQ